MVSISKKTFPPVIRFSSLELMLGSVLYEELEPIQMNVKTAVLNVDLSENIYAEQPEGFGDQEKPAHVYNF